MTHILETIKRLRRSKANGGRPSPRIEQTKNNGIELAEPHWCIMPRGPIGHVDEVNGPGAGLVRDFVPTRYEVLELAKHWAEIQIDLEYFCWLHQTSGSDWSRRVAFAGMRLSRMQKCLGEEVIKKVYDTTFEEFGKRQNPDDWKKYVKRWRQPGE